MISLVTRETKKAFFQDGIMTIPESQRETNHLMTIADAGDSVLAPTISPRTGMVVGKKLPRTAARAVILAHCAPLALRKIWPPALPITLSGAILLQATI